MPTCKDQMPKYLNPTAFMWFVILCLSLLFTARTSVQGEVGPAIVFLSPVVISLVALLLLLKRIVLYRHSFKLCKEYVSNDILVKAAMSDATTRGNLSVPNCLYVGVVCSRCGKNDVIPFFKDTRR